MKTIKKTVLLLTLILVAAQAPTFGQASGGNSGPSGGGGTASSPTGAGEEGANSGLPPGPGTSGQGTSHGTAGPSVGAAGTTTNAPGSYPPTGAPPMTSQPASPHSGGPVSPNS